ncbi:MAG: tetratricopeptide repeat protein [Clostridia bacterium]|nr:tetratricopeptide repeat protein [Clostridia bacterium]
MANIQFRTRNQTNPKGKPRVWFCAHPKDHRAFFEPIVKTLLEKENCAVWYDTEPEAPYNEEDFFADLHEMNLFVMPVTTRLLTTENRALDVEFRYAIEHHIPVLPLMQESGLEALFNEKCGDLQFLDPNSRDLTAISYDEKLTKYLSSVLIGDELAEKIRGAFDAYIFLSYRKKDRKYAQELMRLIHKNEFCRDIAIWYDEFLTPGENFNDSIAEAMAKSKLFALAVTPNLVNEKNYVMTVEYPAAKKAGKKILPAELVKTSRWKLKWKYKDIPECTKAHDEKALTAALEQTLLDIAVRENDNDPEHNFFIGLAYLGGIDVETDHARALSLIESAANAELPEAMEKLVSMYRSGEGVERDYEKAIEWQKMLVAYRKKRYAETGREAESRLYFSELWDLGDYIWELRHVQETEAVYKEMLAVSEEMDGKFHTNRTKRNLSVSYDNLGDIMMSQGKLSEAAEYYGKSLATRGALAEEMGTVESRRDLSVSYEKLGNIMMSQGRPKESAEYYEKSLAICEALAEETGTVESRRDLSVSYNKLGDIMKAQGRPKEAAEYYGKDLAIAEALAEETGTVEAYDDLAVSYYKMAFADQANQRAYRQKALNIWTQLADLCPDDPTFAQRRDLVKKALGIK